ncbi:hypothetical protein KXX33_006781 [Aspergillus fumigatus]|nr:hypothetical protein KXX30_000304 [Aspergillus fumigatus]KAH1286930.1 hypothetical protein KXX48_009499 [Aspergillus fumigatus]KAH1357248.1 hypothetical protein KXX33_006781 [Aspergillus fumigatus]KAH1381796.1 hypothetical protein KXX10_006651 [Aspergillus fumigatus]KAH1481693.1 hypothetical protein KXX26_007569 [Aspergillus fumigatus]
MSLSGDSSKSFRRFLRPTKLRQATFVLPKTGQRLRGLVNLRSSHIATSNDDEERRGLLSGEVSTNRQDVLSPVWSRFSDVWHWTRDFVTSEPGIGVLKCSLAYLLGSLATFIPVVAAFLGHQDGKHVVATVTVYFHPARTQGSMYKALICALLAFLYAAFISLTSMCVSMFFQDTLGMRAVGHAVVLTVFCGGGLGFIGWTKQRFGDPLVNVACSLASLASITVLTKEGAVQSGDLSFTKVVQVLKMVIMGVTATMAVSFSIFPVSARKKLRSNLAIVTETLAIMLVLITDSFLSGSEEELQTTEFLNAAESHKKAYAQLDKLVREAKLEHYVAGTEKEYRLEKNLVRWVQDITHNMGGLRSAASLQFQLLKQAKLAEPQSCRDRKHAPNSTDHLPSPTQLPSHGHNTPLESIDDIPEQRLGGEEEAAAEDDHRDSGDHSDPNPARDEGFSAEHTLQPEDLFALFISHLGPSMRSLAFTLKEIFKEIPFTPAPDYKVSVNSRFHVSLDRALDLYQESREKALKVIYRQKELLQIQTPEVEADLEEVSASCGHFSFSLLEFGEQLKDLLRILDELQLEAEERPNGRSWSWLKVWRWRTAQTQNTKPLDSEQPLLGPTVGEGVTPVASISPFGLEGRQTPPTKRPEKPPAKERLSYRIWKSLGVFRREDTKFAIKVGTGAALYALPAFLEPTRPFYSHWRGTCLGAICAITAWYVTDGNVFGLAILGLVMATWTSYIIVVMGKGPMGRFIMLTYNLSVLYAYSLTQREGSDDQDEGGDSPIITDITLHRVAAVLSGCIWGIIITRVIWPISARKELKNGLSLLWLRMSLIWKRYPLSLLAKRESSTGFMTPREKLEIERFLSRLEALQAAARAEFELKGPFPDAAYSNILRRTRSMVDAFHAMNLEMIKNVPVSEGELALLSYTAQEREHLSARISHLLSVMASSMKLEYPLMDVLPNIEHARDRLLARIFHYRKHPQASQLTTDEDYALLYAYILVTGQLSTEIVEIMEEIGRLFGVLNEDVVNSIRNSPIIRYLLNHLGISVASSSLRSLRLGAIAVGCGDWDLILLLLAGKSSTSTIHPRPPSIASVINVPLFHRDLAHLRDLYHPLPPEQIGGQFNGISPHFRLRAARRASASLAIMQIDPAALSRTDSASTATASSKTAAPGPATTQKSTKALISVPRLDLEPIYTELKAAIGENWAEYKESTTLFLLGHLNQNELASRVDHIICADQKTEHLHNNFICAIIGNLTRDLPDHGVASWVSANDKPSIVSKPSSGDAAEARLKTEVMQLPPRDRRRIKAIPERDPHEVVPNEVEEYHLAKQIKLPSQVPASAGGLNKTNWELEIRKRYAQPLASETGEFPDAESIHARMIPICYEESVVSGAGFPCAEFMAIATETFVKEVLSVVFSRTRCNGPSGTINGMMMRKYRQQLELEELAYTRGEIVKDSATGLLPVEAREARNRKPLGVRDLRLALEIGGGVLSHMPLIVDHIMGGYFEDELETDKQEQIDEVADRADNDSRPIQFTNEMEVEDDAEMLDWEGATAVDRAQLGSLLDECLSLAS